MAGNQPFTALAAAVLGAVFLIAVYGYCAFRLPGDADVMAHGSGIYDMDVQRVVVDLTSELEGYRTSVHPLQKLFIAPAGMSLNSAFFDGTDRLGAAKLLIAAFMTLQAILVGVLAYQLTGRATAPALAAGLLCGVSFTSVLAASLPESAALSSIATTLPLVFLTARIGRPAAWWEAAVWGVIGVVCIGLTITQIAHWLIALGVRGALVARDARANPGSVDLARLTAMSAVSLALAVALTWGAVRAQSRLFPGTQVFYAENPVATERHFFRLGSIGAKPVRHTTRLLAHFALFDFVAPFPGHSDFLIRDYGFDYWSLSIEDAGMAEWTAPQLALAAAVLLAMSMCCVALRRADARFIAPGLCVASQFALHFLYGREYILYSPNWHGVVVAIAVAAVWNATSRRRWLVLAAAGVLASAMLANDWAVLDAVYREVEGGLATNLRDTHGRLLVGR